MDTEASAITLFVFAFMALIPTVASYAVEKGRMILSIAGAAGWLLLGVYAYQNNSQEWDMLYGLFMFAMIMVAVNIFMAVIMREKPEMEPTADDMGFNDDATMKEQEMLKEDRKLFSTRPTKTDTLKGKSVGYTKKVKRSSNFDKTGVL